MMHYTIYHFSHSTEMEIQRNPGSCFLKCFDRVLWFFYMPFVMQYNTLFAIFIYCNNYNLTISRWYNMSEWVNVNYNDNNCFMSHQQMICDPLETGKQRNSGFCIHTHFNTDLLHTQCKALIFRTSVFNYCPRVLGPAQDQTHDLWFCSQVLYHIHC